MKQHKLADIQTSMHWNINNCKNIDQMYNASVTLQKYVLYGLRMMTKVKDLYALCNKSHFYDIVSIQSLLTSQCTRIMYVAHIYVRLHHIVERLLKRVRSMTVWNGARGSTLPPGFCSPFLSPSWLWFWGGCGYKWSFSDAGMSVLYDVTKSCDIYQY